MIGMVTAAQNKVRFAAKILTPNLPLQWQLRIERPLFHSRSSLPNDDGCGLFNGGPGVHSGRECHHVLLIRRKVNELNSGVTEIGNFTEVLTTPDGNTSGVESSEVGAKWGPLEVGLSPARSGHLFSWVWEGTRVNRYLENTIARVTTLKKHALCARDIKN